ncbi:MAG: hypothetical protein WB967_28785 [Mycobacterium sp.]|uniref:hypothetical protein n=1 Tax=Mycobacterium sp. TaxID=1785 RepID=UPI003C37CFAB
MSETMKASTPVAVSPEASATFFKIVSDGVKSEKQTTIPASYTFKQSDIPQNIPPKSWGYVCTSNPLSHYVGTLTASAGNTTWTLPGVAADFPNSDPNAKGVVEVWDKTEELPGDPCPGFLRGPFPRTRATSPSRGAIFHLLLSLAGPNRG